MVARLATAAVALAALLAAADAQNTARLCASATCFAEGAAECDRASASCPPCMYEITGGAISCYSKENGACPFPDPLVDCPAKTTPAPTIKPSPTPTVKPTPSPSPSPSPKATSEQPATVAPPLIDTPTATASQSSHPNSLQNDPKTTSSVDVRVVTQHPSTSSAPTSMSSSSATSDTKKAAAATPTPATAPVNTLESSSGLSSGRSSSAFLNIGVVIAAVAGTAIVALFVTRRMKQRREMRFLETPEDSNKQFNLQVDGRRTPVSRRGDDGTSGAGVHPPGIGTAAAVPVVTKVALAAGTRVARANSNTSEAPSLLSMASLGSSTGEFHHPHYQQYAAPPSYGAPPAYGLASEASSFRTSSNVSASSAAFVYSSNGLSRPQLAPAAEDPTVASKRKQSSAWQSHQPVYQPPLRRKSSAISLASGNVYEDEYDIVRPGALQDAEHRNTETLMEDGRFQSNFSDSDVRALQGERHFFDSREHEI